MSNNSRDLPQPADTEKESPLADELSDQDLEAVSGGAGQTTRRHTGYDDLEQTTGIAR